MAKDSISEEKKRALLIYILYKHTFEGGIYG